MILYLQPKHWTHYQKPELSKKIVYLYVCLSERVFLSARENACVRVCVCMCEQTYV